MSRIIKLRKGYDIKLQGEPAKAINPEFYLPDTVAIKPPDLLGFGRMKVLAWPGTKVKAGTPLFASKKNLDMKVTAPVSGEVVEIVRGEKRKPLAFKLLADRDFDYEDFGQFSVSDIHNLSAEDAKQHLLSSGAWINLVQRPYSVIANPEDTPKAIFISTFDSAPLAPDYNFIFKNNEQYFQQGVNVLKKLTTGHINVGIDADAELAQVFAQCQGVSLHKFSGPHPAGNVGVHIHHIDPIVSEELVWTVNPWGVIQIGKLFLEGKMDHSRTIALTGSEVKEPQYYNTVTGANIQKLLEGKLHNEHARVISGNVLCGEKLGEDDFMGYYDHQVTVIPEGDHHEFLGWILPSTQKFSLHRAFGLLSFLNPNKPRVLDSNLHGEHRPFVETGVLDNLVPMDIHPLFLLKAILANDLDNMEQLGILEVAEEDLALCEFVDVSKNEIQKIIRQGLDMMMEE